MQDNTASLKDKLEGLEGLLADSRVTIDEATAIEFVESTGLGPCGAISMAARELTGMPIAMVWVGNIRIGYAHYLNVTSHGTLVDFSPLETGVKIQYSVLEILPSNIDPELYTITEAKLVKTATINALKKAGYLMEVRQ